MVITLPNILITGEKFQPINIKIYRFKNKNRVFKCLTGTPGVGKSRICAEIAKHRPLKWQDVSKIAKDSGFVKEFDSRLECPILDEDAVGCFANDLSEKFY